MTRRTITLPEHHAHGPGVSRPGFMQGSDRALWDPPGADLKSQIVRSHSPFHVPEVIHGARIATKRLRYLLEVFHDFERARQR
jgi:hypothetical protein